MAVDVDILFRGMAANPSIEAAVERWVGRLEAVAVLDRCTVEICRSQLGATSFRVDIDVWFEDTAGIEDTREAIADHDDVYVAVANAFRGSYRQLTAERGRRVRLATPSRGRSAIVARAEPAQSASIATLLDLPVPA